MLPRCFLFTLLLVVHLPVRSISGLPTVSVPPRPATWTVLLYMAADNDLEKPILADYNELERVGSSQQVQFVVQMDRESGAGRWIVEQDDHRKEIGSSILMDLGKIDSGSVGTLEAFLVWGIEHYPAKHYALIIAGHGASWGGVAWDSSTGSYMKIVDLSDMLHRVAGNTGIGAFDVIAFDACLMGGIEVAEELSDNTNVMVASAQMVDYAGLNYEGFAQAILGQPDADGETFGGLLVQTFGDYYAPSGTNYMLVALDTAKIAGVITALDDLIAVLDPAQYEIVGDAYNRSFAYMADYYADLGHLAENVADLSDDEAVSGAALALAQAIDEAVLQRVSGPVGVDASGLSIYFPHYTDMQPEYVAFLRNPVWGRWAAWVGEMKK